MLRSAPVDVRCEGCQTEYELEDASVSEEGTQVQCMACGRKFLVTRPVLSKLVEPDSSPPAQWLLETADGQQHRFRHLTSLQKWIIERKVTREDRLSRTGHAWRKLRELVELEPFFEVVEEADKARAAVSTVRPQGLEAEARQAREVGASARALSGVAKPLEPPASPPADLEPAPPEMETAVVLVRGDRALKAVLALGVAAMVAYVGIKQYLKRPGNAAATVRSEAAPAEVPAAPRPVVAEPSVAAIPPAPVEVIAPPPTPAPAPAEAAARETKPEPRPESPPVAYEKLIATADRLLENGSGEKARSLYDQALKLNPRSPEALAGLGYIALDRGRTPQAFSYFKKSLEVRPSFGPAVFGLAEAHRTSGDDEIAVGHYRHYLVVDPGGTDVLAARQHIKSLEAKLAARGAAGSQPSPAP